MAKRLKVAVTGAAGQIGYALLFRIAAGEMFGSDTEVDLSLLELEKALPALAGVVMELDDCAFPLLRSVSVSADPNAAFKDIDWALLVGSVPRKEGMERGELLKINGGVFTGPKARRYQPMPNQPARSWSSEIPATPMLLLPRVFVKIFRQRIFLP